MNNIHNSVNFDTPFIKSYLAILKNRKVVNHRDRTRKIIQEATEELASSFEAIPSNINDVFTCLKNHLRKNPKILGSAFAFAPEIMCSCPFVLRDVDRFISKDIADTFMYSNAVWYEAPVKQRKPVWSVPYFDIGKSGEDILLTTYSVPVFSKDSSMFGVVISDLLLARLEDIQKIE
ncbi:MAG: PDC sensor domain-containing protein [Rivularia sp. (in: Bacteria)]|nr:PDC sensor domain-containing protein [Rivularia sp. MS3]